jgi:uncharacterized membrane protein YhaH (DUF805 family)
MTQDPSRENPYGQAGERPSYDQSSYGQDPQYGHQPQYGQAPQSGGQYYQAPQGYQAGPSSPAGPSGSGGEPPLSRPLYGASLGQAVRRFFKKYTRFSGYASRSEYWWVALAWAVLYMVVAIAGGLLFGVLASNSANMETTTGSGSASFEAEGGAAIALMVFGLISFAIWVALVVPYLALSWRRLHDAGLPGPMWFLGLIPGVGGLIVLILMLLPTNTERRNPQWEDRTGD